MTPLREAVRGLASDPGSIPPGADRLELVAGDKGEIAAAPTPSETIESGRSARVRQTIAGLELTFEAGSFSQANRAIAECLVLRAVGTSRGALGVDLYAGAGLFTLALARRFTLVHAVESDAASVRLGRENARANGIDNVRWSGEDVKAWLVSAGRELRPDLVLLDPPRAGAGRAVVEGIAELRPRELAYVSCDPATWARDLRLFVDRGYAIRTIAALDMFPRSYHVEVVAHLSRDPNTDTSLAPAHAPSHDR
jgi:23S rRNA (uracil1939-C5)-methyltransferase